MNITEEFLSKLNYPFIGASVFLSWTITLLLNHWKDRKTKRGRNILLLALLFFLLSLYCFHELASHPLV